ncbi:MAG: ABC transporter ATP-binding protein [Anaerolineales bacterium]
MYFKKVANPTMNVPIREYWNLLDTYLKPQWRRVSLLTFLLFISIGLQLYIPQVIRNFIDTAQSGAKLNTLTRMAIIFLVVALVKELAIASTQYFGQDVRWRATNALRRDLALHCLRLDMGFHNLRTPGKMIERVDGDVNELSNFFSQFAIQVLGNTILLAGVLLMMFREDYRVGAVFLAFVLCTTFVLSKVRHIAVENWTAARESSAEMFGFLEERLAGTEDIAGLGAGRYIMRRLHQAMYKNMIETRRAYVKGGMMWVTTIIIFTLGNIVAFGLGAWLFQNGAITLGTVYLIFHYTEMLRRPLEQITRQLQDLQRAGGSIVRIRELYHLESKAKDGTGDPIPAGALSVKFDHLTFSYNGEDTILDDVHFSLEPGQVVGLLGRTGSGKTTIARLLFRLYDATEGTIRLGDVDLRDARLRQLRDRVGMVTQEVQLFHATVRDNLTFFDRAIPDERIVAVLQDLGLYDWVQSLPDGLDTELESGGGGLSAGEAQLFAFTRVFLGDPGLIILDEASSRLDPATEQLIERAVDRLLENRTAIIIAHRLATVRRADEIMILEAGRVVEHGPREYLATNATSRFFQLMQTGMEEVLV